MTLPVQITFRNFSSTPALEEHIRDKASRLERYYDHIMSCRVLVEERHRHHRQGRLFHVRIELGVPHGEVVVSREPDEAHEHEDVYVALRDAFDAARRRLEDRARTARHDVKSHEAPQHGTVARLFAWDGYGFIVLSDGTEVYFHKNAVIAGRWEDLDVGQSVRVVVAEREGEHGPQASTVELLERRHILDAP